MEFAVEVVKHEETDSNAVLVYLNGKELVCVAHSIDPRQIPASDQVSVMCVFPVVRKSISGTSCILLQSNH